VVARLNSLRDQVASGGVRRVDFSDIPALQGPNQTARSIPLGLIDANWNCVSSLETAFLQHLEVRKSQTAWGTIDGGFSVLSILTAGGTDIISEGVQPLLLSYDLVGDFTTVPDGPVAPMTAMNENEFEMSMYLVEDLANLYEIANCTSAYVTSSLAP
jgi:hypothetical protein